MATELQRRGTPGRAARRLQAVAGQLLCEGPSAHAANSSAEPSTKAILSDVLAKAPVVAILRGVLPSEVLPIAQALFEGGVRALEVTMNSPDPIKSIAKLVRWRQGLLESKRIASKYDLLIGAGTVLRPSEAARVRAVGAELIVTPNADPDVVRAAKLLGMVVCAGFYTPTEAFRMLDCGADSLKLFPAAVTPPKFLKALRAVLPKDCLVLAVGGVSPSNAAVWRACGASGYGVGSALYKKGLSPEQVRDRTAKFMAAVSGSK